MDSFPPIVRIVDATSGDSGRDPLFQTGAILKARVVSLDPAGQARLKIGNQVIQAVFSHDIEPGGEIRLRVAQTEPRVILEVLPETASESTPAKNAGRAIREEAAPREQAPFILRARVLSPPKDGRIKIKITSAPRPSLPEESLGGPHREDFRPSGSKGAASRMTDPGTFSRPGLMKQLAAGREITARFQGGGKGMALAPNQEAYFFVRETSPYLVLQMAEGESPASHHPPFIRALTSFLSEPGPVVQSGRCFHGNIGWRNGPGPGSGAAASVGASDGPVAPAGPPGF